jgi:hypothetical protein
MIEHYRGTLLGSQQICPTITPGGDSIPGVRTAPRDRSTATSTPRAAGWGSNGSRSRARQSEM